LSGIVFGVGVLRGLARRRAWILAGHSVGSLVGWGYAGRVRRVNWPRQQVFAFAHFRFASGFLANCRRGPWRESHEALGTHCCQATDAGHSAQEGKCPSSPPRPVFMG
jgi:hypothetical protein